MSKRKSDEEGRSVPEKIPASDKDILRCGSFETKFSSSVSEKISDVHFVGNIPWNIRCRQKHCGLANQLNVDLLCDHENISPMWKVETNFKIVLVSQSQGVDDLEQSGDFCFDSKNNSCSTSFGSYNDLVSNFVMNGMIEFKVLIEIKKVAGIEFYELDFSKSTSMTDVVLVVEGKKIHSNKAFLAMHSSVFEAMFFSGFKEENQEEIELKDIKYDELVDLLTFIHPSGEVPIHKKNIENLLELADRFDIKKVVHLCSKFLMTTTDVSNSRKFEIADKYSLTELHNQALKSLSHNQMYAMRNGPEYNNFKAASKDGLIDRLLQMMHYCSCRN